METMTITKWLEIGDGSGGGDEPTNLVTLCINCHLKRHGKEKHD